MDIVGPLPKCSRGHQYILVTVDDATRYQEAVPLRKANAKQIAKELFLLSSQVGIPKSVVCFVASEAAEDLGVPSRWVGREIQQDSQGHPEEGH